MIFFSVLKTIANHPLNRKNKLKAILRFVKWQLSTRLTPYPILYQFTRKSKLIVVNGLTGATGNLYCGLMEFNDMSFLLHFLRKDDQFVDIGANIGSYTILASAHVGATTIAFEPLPSTFEFLQNNIVVNQIENIVESFNLALGSQQGELDFTSTAGAANHVAKASDKDVVKVKVEKLDTIMSGKNPPLLMKIDVEGFETEVIAGAMETINNPSLQAIIIELRGHGARYGYDEQQLNDKLEAASFKPYHYDGFKRKLSLLDSYFGAENTIYIRDVEFVKERIALAPYTKIFDFEI